MAHRGGQSRRVPDRRIGELERRPRRQQFGDLVPGEQVDHDEPLRAELLVEVRVRQDLHQQTVRSNAPIWFVTVTRLAYGACPLAAAFTAWRTGPLSTS